ncbi:MAG: type II toxin-antitoxin system HicA family toxin [Gammaproteobacteria bacterium]|nr:type II toxin-antitoxin system HicA family toxin [Gammaproteobacteria bacterium]
MKVREVIRILEVNGFRQVRQTGSHRRFEGVVGGRTRLVTVAGNTGEEVSVGTLASIRRQSGLPRRLFRSD